MGKGSRKLNIWCSDLHLILCLSCVIVSVGKPAHFLPEWGKQCPAVQEAGGDLGFSQSLNPLPSSPLQPHLPLRGIWHFQEQGALKQHLLSAFCPSSHPRLPTKEQQLNQHSEGSYWWEEIKKEKKQRWGKGWRRQFGVEEELGELAGQLGGGWHREARWWHCLPGAGG